MVRSIREINDSFTIEEILGEQKVLELKFKLYGIEYEFVDLGLSEEMRTKKINSKTIYEYVTSDL